MWGLALTQALPQSALSGEWGCLLCQSSVPPGHPLLRTSPGLWGWVVELPPALHSNLRDMGGTCQVL